MKKLLLFLLTLAPSMAFGAGAGGINITPNLISFIRAIAVLQNGTLLGGASYFNFTGGGCTASVNGATATINCTGGGGGGGGSSVFIYNSVNSVAVSTFSFPNTDFLVVSDGAGSSTVTVRNATGTWTAAQLVRSSWTVQATTMVFRNGYIAFGTDTPRSDAMLTFSSAAGSRDLIISASTGTYEYFRVNPSSWFSQIPMFVVPTSTFAGGLTLGSAFGSNTKITDQGVITDVGGNVGSTFNGTTIILNSNGEATFRNGGTAANNAVGILTASLINGHINFRPGGTLRDSFNADGALVVGGSTTTAGNVMFEVNGGIAKISSHTVIAGNVGIGTTLPSDAQLEIQGLGSTADTKMLRFSNAANSAFYWEQWRDNTTGELDFGEALGGAKSTRVTFLTGGNVGINTTVPATSLEVQGGFTVKTTATSGNITVDATHNTIYGTGGTVGITATLPAASATTIGRIYYVFKVDAGVGTVAVAPNGTDTLNGLNANKTIANQWNGCRIQGHTATGWLVTSFTGL